MNRIAMNELTTYRWSFEEDVRHYAEAGLNAIGVWRAKLSDYGEEKGVVLLDEFGMEVSSLLWAGGFTGSDGRSHRESIADAHEAIHLAAELSAGCLIVYSGAKMTHTRNHARRLFRTALDQLVPIAEEHGVTLAVEPMPRRCGADFTFLNGLDDAAELVRRYESDSLKLALDTYCLTDCSFEVATLTDLAKDVAIVQVGDGKQPPRNEPNRCMLGEGVVPLADIVAALRVGGYQGCWEVELLGEDVESADYGELLRSSRVTLERLLGDDLS